MSAQWIFIEPADVWMFRDNKPFTAQQNFVARSIFPPTPMTMQGVVRSYYLERTGADWSNLSSKNSMIGDSTSLGQLHLSGPFVARRQNGSVKRLFKAPLDLLRSKDAPHTFRLLSPGDSRTFDTEPPFDDWRPLTGGGEGFKEAEGWLTEAQFKQYLTGNIQNLGDLLCDHAVFQKEERVGLGLNRTSRANEQGMFYHAEFIRLVKDVGLLLRVEPDNWFVPSAGLIEIGGESRSGRYEIVNAPDSLKEPTGKNVRIALLTPAYFSNGYQPAKDTDWSRWLGKGAKLVSVVLGKSHPISGWDIARNEPKPLRHFVPAGSVFYFENAAPTDQPFTESSPDGVDYGAMGFGTFAAGNW